MQFVTQLERYRFEKYLLEATIRTLEKGGITSQLSTYHFLDPIDAWGFPKYPAKTAILPPDIDLCAELRRFIEANEGYLREPGSYLGTWINPHTQHCYLDITTSRKELDEARQEAMAISLRDGRRIVALYNILRGQLVYLWEDVLA